MDTLVWPVSLRNSLMLETGTNSWHHIHVQSSLLPRLSQDCNIVRLQPCYNLWQYDRLDTKEGSTH